MSLHYILDGYNIIKQPDFLDKKLLRDAREDLVRFIKEKKPCGSKNNQVTVVFDGICSLDLPHRDDRVEVIFTQHHSADTRIKKWVAESKNPKRIVVVSDDKDIQFFIKSCGAKALSCAQFLSKGRTPHPKNHPKDSPKVELSYQEAAQINKELAKIWLK